MRGRQGREGVEIAKREQRNGESEEVSVKVHKREEGRSGREKLVVCRSKYPLFKHPSPITRPKKHRGIEVPLGWTTKIENLRVDRRKRYRSCVTQSAYSIQDAPDRTKKLRKMGGI